MKSVNVNGCNVDLVPVIRGFVAGKDIIRPLFDKSYDAVGVSLGPEDLTAMSERADISEPPSISDLDAVYAHFLMKFGEIALPTPAYSELVDVCKELSVELIPLDMNDEEYTELFCGKVKTMDLLKETRIAKKAIKRKFKANSPEGFAIEWDDYVNKKIKGLFLLSLEREAFMANEIAHVAEGKKNLLAIVETERMAGILDLLR